MTLRKIHSLDEIRTRTESLLGAAYLTSLPSIFITPLYLPLSIVVALISATLLMIVALRGNMEKVRNIHLRRVTWIVLAVYTALVLITTVIGAANQ